MNDNNAIDSELLARYIAGEADADQRAAVEAWAASADENAQELRAMQRLWSVGGEASSYPEADTDAAWRRIEARMDEHESLRSDSKGRASWRVWLAAAAIIGGIVFAVRLFEQTPAEHYAAKEQAVAFDLSDGSKAVLASGSRLEARMGSTRMMRLEGSAYFDVRRDTTHPFVIEAGDLEVMVLGTSFEVSAYDSASQSVVRVRSGRVRVVAGNDTLVLGAGEHARYHKDRHFLERAAALPIETWGLRVLQFEGASLDQVAAQLQRLYHVRIEWRNEAIARCRLTAEFDDESIERIVAVIAETFSLQVERTGKGYLLDGKGC